MLKLKLEGGFACGVVAPLADLAPPRFWNRLELGAELAGVLLAKMLLVFLFCWLAGVEDAVPPKSEDGAVLVFCVLAPPPKRLLLELGAEVVVAEPPMRPPKLQPLAPVLPADVLGVCEPKPPLVLPAVLPKRLGAAADELVAGGVPD